MHVAVAPACNIQCNYCNRKYDCANESRPGVVSERLTPEQAAKKVVVVASTIPQMTVLGIAGPGDPLANPAKTFKTFELISAPEHGTVFGLTGQRGPTARELKALQDSCEGEMNMMRHCRQCRADAVGL